MFNVLKYKLFNCEIINWLCGVADGRSESGECAGRLLSVCQGDDDAEQNPRPDEFDGSAKETKLLETVRFQCCLMLRLRWVAASIIRAFT